MATIMNPDGTTQDITPADGKAFTLKELQTAVGGYVQALYMPKGRIILVHEEGKLKGLPVNTGATLLWHSLNGRNDDVLVGPALVCTRKEMG